MANVLVHNKTSQSLRIAIKGSNDAEPRWQSVAPRAKFGPINQGDLTAYNQSLVDLGRIRLVTV